MTVEQLINELKKYNPNLIVLGFEDGGCFMESIGANIVKIRKTLTEKEIDVINDPKDRWAGQDERYGDYIPVRGNEKGFYAVKIE